MLQIKTLLSKLEDPKRPLLGPNIKLLKFWGLLLPENVFKKYFYIVMHLCVTIFTATECVDVWFIKDELNLIFNNLKITMLAVISVTKIVSFLFWQKNWKNIIDYVTRADKVQRQTKDKTKMDIIKNYTRYCRRITYLYWFLMYTTVTIVILHPMLRFLLSPSYRENVKNGTEVYLQVVSSWVPFNKNKLPGYLGASILQSYAAIYGGGWITSFDSNAMVIMVFFRGELELLRRDCAMLFHKETDGNEDLVRLKDCQRRHVELVKYCRLFDAHLSPIMLTYMLVCSVMLCVTAYQITSQTSAMERFLTTEYLLFGVAQLFIYCWHSNAVLYASQNLASGPYESCWYATEPKKCKNVFILTSQFRRTIVFSAGPFTQLTVATFINILRGAYSYYTLLSKSQMK